MANLTPVQLDKAGANVLTLAAATGGGDTVINALPGVYLVVNNGSGSSVTVTLTEAVKCNHNHPLTNPTYAVAAGKQLPIYVPDFCIDASGHVGVAYSSATSVTVAAYYH